jgi:hypothetical protein
MRVYSHGGFIFLPSRLSVLGGLISALRTAWCKCRCTGQRTSPSQPGLVPE